MNLYENLNDVNEILESINKVLSRGVKDRHSDYHTFSVATSANNLINNRTVVLRDFSYEKKLLCYHTNFLSEKISELKKNNNIACLFYSKKDKVQIRINGKAHINNGNQICKEKWKTMSEQSKLCYFQNHNPGKKVANPVEVKQSANNSISKLFSIITVDIEKIDWLYLSRLGHKRVFFLKKNNFDGYWVAP
tara:strand:+ start:49 stop:624 length:576 start_codon:yes stop_codon:yes gene_type:complete